MMQAWPRCRVCQRIHGLPRCEPVADEVSQEAAPEGIVNTVNTPPAKPIDRHAPGYMAAYMRDYRKRKRAAE